MTKLGLDAEIVQAVPATSSLSDTTNTLLETIIKTSKSGSRLVIVQLISIVDIETARALVASIRSRTHSSSDIKAFCVSISSYRVEANITFERDGQHVGLPFNSYFILTCLKRLLARSQANASEASKQLFEQTRSFLNKSVDSNSLRSLGFDSFIGFPFVNSDNEQAYMQASDYISCLATIQAIIQTKTEAEQAVGLAKRLQNDKEWWSVAAEDASRSEYEAFIIRSISTVVKKFESLQQQVVKPKAAAVSSKPVIDLLFEQREVESNQEIENQLKKALKPIVNENAVGKRKKPDSIAIVSNHNSGPLLELLKTSTIEAVRRLIDIDPAVDVDLLEMQAMNSWKFKDPIKVTVLHIDNSILNREQDAIYNRFKADEPFPFLIHGVVYIPGVCVVGVTNIDRSLIKMEGSLDYTTIMTRDYRYGTSRSVVEQVFADADMRRHRSCSLNTLTRVGVVDILLGSKSLRAYVVPFRRKILIDATTRSVVAANK